MALKKFDFKETSLIFLRGLLMGFADVIPGVSGGTIAFITGIYSRLVHSISSIDFSFIFSFLKMEFKNSYITFRKIDFALFLPLGLGILISLYSFSWMIEYLLISFPAFTFAFFFGLILASAWFVFKKTGKIKYERIIFSALGFIFAYSIAGVTAISVNHSLLIIFLSGALAICAMILPGISGAFILLLLNQYQFLINALHNLDKLIIGVFGLGALIGLLSFSKLLDYLLCNFKKLTLSFLVGLMVGSLRVPLNQMSTTSDNLWLVLLFVIIGFMVVFLLEFSMNKKTN
ncbi:MAG: DUF368 domain-containing protein [Nanoarchaeota archaeon]|nr:DUF368 domain-containing protein [Nanoarchaeota archaeon]MBU1632322.1 DUF368 domain-containing protein [Nanoarchaeota archaeon]MBU1875881.1 DUF368 domain-containing protein [Nanoarchaeota archaeon]